VRSEGERGGAWGKGKESECEEWKTEGGGPTCAVAVAKRKEVGRTAGNPRSGKRTKDRQTDRGLEGARLLLLRDRFGKLMRKDGITLEQILKYSRRRPRDAKKKKKTFDISIKLKVCECIANGCKNLNRTIKRGF
jgi:hypothetical protein